MFNTELMFLLLLPLVAFLYASVGHGGASGYLALMALFAVPTALMKPTALLLNLFVAGAAAWHYYRNGYFRWQLFLGFAIGSVPSAYVGGLLTLEPYWYQRVLAVLLLFAVLKMLNLLGASSQKHIKQPVLWQSILIGAFIGLSSGLIGIGGGIILSPVILLLHWGSMKETAAVSAVFIWVNSAAGLAGQWTSGIEFHPQIAIWVGLALIGGLMGSYLGSRRLNNLYLKRLLALVLLMASVKLVAV